MLAGKVGISPARLSSTARWGRAQSLSEGLADTLRSVLQAAGAERALLQGALQEGLWDCKMSRQQH